jgi:hypothetical protein
MSHTRKRNIAGIIFLVLACIPLWFNPNLPIGVITYQTVDYYNAITAVPEGGIVCLGYQGFKTEGYAGIEDSWVATVYYIHQRGLKLVCLSLGPLANAVFEDIYSRGKLVERFDLEYGVDYVFTPFIPGEETALAAFARDIPGTVPTDYLGTPISQLSIFDGLQTLSDIDLCWASSYSAMNYEQYIRQWGYAYDMPIILNVHGYGSIAAWYPWPMVGVITGMKQYAEFEMMVGYFGQELQLFQSTSFIGLIGICFVAFAIAYNATKRRRERALETARDTTPTEGL